MSQRDEKDAHRPPEIYQRANLRMIQDGARPAGVGRDDGRGFASQHGAAVSQHVRIPVGVDDWVDCKAMPSTRGRVWRATALVTGEALIKSTLLALEGPGFRGLC